MARSLSTSLRMRAVVLLLLGAVMVLATPVPARAQVTAGSQDAARDAFTAGESAFTAHDYEAALAQFRRAFELRPHDAVRFNLAVCYERLARFREAVLEYEAAAVSAQLDDAGRQRAREQAERIRPWLAMLVIEGTPAGAAVLVDGESRCSLPCRVPVDPRPHVVIVRTPEGEQSRPVDPERGAEVVVRFDTSARRAAGPAASARATRPRRPRAQGRSHIAAGPLTAVGAGLVVAGVTGLIVFGLRAQSLHDDFALTPTSDLADRGALMRNLANVSIGVAALGAIVIVVDLLVLRAQTPNDEPRITATLDGLSVAF